MTIQIYAIIGEFLGNNLELFHSALYQFLYFCENFFDGAADVRTGDEGNGAIGAAAVATFRDLEKGVVLWRGKHAGIEGLARSTLRKTGGGKIFDEVFPVELSVETIHFGDFFP